MGMGMDHTQGYTEDSHGMMPTAIATHARTQRLPGRLYFGLRDLEEDVVPFHPSCRSR
jgi:hypothetical protein